MPEKSSTQSTLLQQRPCSVGAFKQRKYRIRSTDGKIYAAGAWRSVSSFIRLRAAQRQRWNQVKSKPGFREAANARAREKYWKDPEAGREKSRKWWAKLNDDQVRSQNKRIRSGRQKDLDAYRAYRRKYYAANREKHLSDLSTIRVRRDPSRGLKKVISDFRHGKIGFDELDRRICDALKGIDAVGLLNKRKPGRKRKHPGDTGRL